MIGKTDTEAVATFKKSLKRLKKILVKGMTELDL